MAVVPGRRRAACARGRRSLCEVRHEVECLNTVFCGVIRPERAAGQISMRMM